MAGTLPTWRNPTGNPFAGVAGLMNSANRSWQQGSDALSQALANPLKRQQAQEERDAAMAMNALKMKDMNQDIANGLLDQQKKQFGLNNQQGSLDAQRAEEAQALMNAKLSGQNTRDIINRRSLAADKVKIGQEYQNKLFAGVGEYKFKHPNATNAEAISAVSGSLIQNNPQYSQHQVPGFESVNTALNLRTDTQKKQDAAKQLKLDLVGKGTEALFKAGGKAGNQLGFGDDGKITSQNIFTPPSNKGDRKYGASSIIDNTAKLFNEGGTTFNMNEKEVPVAKSQLIYDSVIKNYPDLKGKELSAYVKKIAGLAADNETSFWGGGVNQSNVTDYIVNNPYK